MANKRKFESAEDLMAAVRDYFLWADNNPIRGSRTISKEDGEVVTRDAQYPRPYTFEGMSKYIGIADWHAYVQDNKEREGFAEAFAEIRNIVRANQIEGAMVGVYREGITARLNGIAENIKINEKPVINLLSTEIE